MKNTATLGVLTNTFRIRSSFKLQLSLIELSYNSIRNIEKGLNFHWNDSTNQRFVVDVLTVSKEIGDCEEYIKQKLQKGADFPVSSHSNYKSMRFTEVNTLLIFHHERAPVK